MRVLAERISSYPFGPLFTLDDVELVLSGIKTGLIDILDAVDLLQEAAAQVLPLVRQDTHQLNEKETALVPEKSSCAE